LDRQTDGRIAVSVNALPYGGGIISKSYVQLTCFGPAQACINRYLPYVLELSRQRHCCDQRRIDAELFAQKIARMNMW